MNAAIQQLTNMPIGAILPIIHDPDINDMADEARDDVVIFIKRAVDQWERREYPFAEPLEGGYSDVAVALLVAASGSQQYILEPGSDTEAEALAKIRGWYEAAIEENAYASVTGAVDA